METSLAFYTGLLGMRSTPPVDIVGVRMLFVYDPDQTPIEFIELPDGAQRTLQMWRPPA